MEGYDVHSSSPVRSQPTLELSPPVRRGGKVGRRTEAIPSSMPQRRKWNAGPSGQFRAPARVESPEFQFVGSESLGRRGAAYDAFHATLAGDTAQHRATRERMFGGGNEEVRRNMFDTPKARPQAQYVSPDPLLLTTPTPPAKRKVKALTTVSTLKVNQDATTKIQKAESLSRYDQRSPSPLPPPSQAKKVPRRVRRTPSPAPPLPIKKAKTNKTSVSDPAGSKPDKPLVKGKSKSASNRKRFATPTPTPSPADQPSSQETLDGSRFFSRVEAEEKEKEEKEWDEFLHNALNPMDDPEWAASRADRDELKALRAREEEEEKRMRRIRKQRSGTSTRSHADSFFKNADEVAEQISRRRSLEAKSLA